MPVCDGPRRKRKQSSKRDGDEADAAPPHGPGPLLSAQRHTRSVIESFGVHSWGAVRLPEAETCLTVF